MASHYKLKATIGSTEVVRESLELTGSKSFKVFPVEKNETQAPIRGSAVVSILGKNHSIQLNHRTYTHEDVEPSATKWSYVENLYTTGTTPVPSADIKRQKTGYARASRGTTIYQSPMSPSRTLIISRAYTTYQSLIDTVGDFSDPTVGTIYQKNSIMSLFTFVMFYKYASEVEGVVIPPVDDGTPASNKARIPCRPEASGAPEWIRGRGIAYQVNFTHVNSGSGTRSFGTWNEFITFWNSIKTNSEYTDAVFHYIYQGIVDFNESLSERPGSGYGNITISEIDNGDGIHGAEPLYLILSQQEGKNNYGAAIMPASSSSLDSQGGTWSFDDLSAYTISQNKLSGNNGVYTFKPKFKIKSSSSYYARSISVITGGSVIVNPDGADTVDYQYIGQPFILKLYKENANGIEGQYMRPYYKITAESSSTGTEFWKDSINIMGAQNFNPIQYDEYIHPDFYHLHLRNSGYRGFISGPTDGDHGMFILQLIPMCIYTWTGDEFTMEDDLDGEGGVGTKGINYVNRYDRYESAIGGADTPGQNSTDVYKAAFLKWPNEDGNNAPDHIDPTGIIESLPSKMGKTWENWVQNFGEYKFINRVMFVPVLWTQKRLEEYPDMRSYLSSASFGSYLLSPGISDAEIDTNPSCIKSLLINGIDIQIN